MIRKVENTLIVFLSVLFLCPAFVCALDELYDAPGFDPNRETFSSMPNEHIDTFTGGLILSFEDIRLPGNGGLDLVIQRTYNSKNTCNEWTGGISCTGYDENTWLGYGWTLHLGRLFKSNNVNKPHVIEMPDGSRHSAYLKVSSSYYITKDYWLLDINTTPFTLTMADGTKVYYAQSGPAHPDYPNHFAYLATKIQDANGNEINIYYQSSGSDKISYVIDSVGRRIDFNTATINGAVRLVSITGPGVSVSYTHQSTPTWYRTFLTQANPPLGNPWGYAYDGITFELIQLTTPSGGIVNYVNDVVEVNMGFIFFYRAVIQK